MVRARRAVAIAAWLRTQSLVRAGNRCGYAVLRSRRAVGLADARLPAKSVFKKCSHLVQCNNYPQWL
jgi:hypothetical protein